MGLAHPQRSPAAVPLLCSTLFNTGIFTHSTTPTGTPSLSNKLTAMRAITPTPIAPLVKCAYHPFTRQEATHRRYDSATTCTRTRVTHLTHARTYACMCALQPHMCKHAQIFTHIRRSSTATHTPIPKLRSLPSQGCAYCDYETFEDESGGHTTNHSRFFGDIDPGLSPSGLDSAPAFVSDGPSLSLSPSLSST